MTLDSLARLLSKRGAEYFNPKLFRLRSSLSRPKIRRLTPNQRDAEREAMQRATGIAAKFSKTSRQQRRHESFAACLNDVNRLYGPEPRQARRRMARAIAKRGIQEARP